jgi:hypothetical protein
MAWHGRTTWMRCWPEAQVAVTPHGSGLSVCVCRRASFPCSMDTIGTERERGWEKSAYRNFVDGEKDRCDDQKAIYIYLCEYIYTWVSI